MAIILKIHQEVEIVVELYGGWPDEINAGKRPVVLSVEIKRIFLKTDL